MHGHRKAYGVLAALAAIITGLMAASLAQGQARSGPIQVEQTRLFFLPDQNGGHYHTAVALVRNTSNAARWVSGQFTIRDGRGLVGTADATPMLVPAHAESLMLGDAINLPRPVPHGKLTLTLADDDPWKTQPRVRFANAHYMPSSGDFDDCRLEVRVTSAESKKLSITGIYMVALYHGRIVSAGYTYPDLYPHTPKLVDIDQFSPALCPMHVDQVRAFVG